MSRWTHIHAGITVDFGNAHRWEIYDFFRRMKDENYTLCFDLAKKGNGFEITGSELNATVVFSKTEEYELNHECRYFRDNKWSIHIHGSLRDRELHETVAEWHRFAWKLGWFIRDIRKLCKHQERHDEYRYAEIKDYFVEISDGYEAYRRSSCMRLKEYKKGGVK